PPPPPRSTRELAPRLDAVPGAEARGLPERATRARQRQLPQPAAGPLLLRARACADREVQGQRGRRPEGDRLHRRRSELPPRLDAAHAAVRVPAGEAA